MSDPSIGRFWQIDPLAAKYSYNSTYAFQENKLGIGTELEGKEVKRFEWLDDNNKNHIDYTADIKVYNNSSASTAEIIEYATGVANSIGDNFNGVDSDENIVSTSVNLEFTDKVDAEKDYFMEFTDHVESDSPSNGIVNEIGNSEVNRIQLLIPGKAAGSSYEKVTKEGLFTTGAHEFGHTVGLSHQDSGSNITKNNITLQNSNLMYYTHSIGRQKGGVNPSQLSEMRENVNLGFLVKFNKWLRSLD